MSWKSNRNPMFRSQFSESIFDAKYKHEGASNWEELAHTLVEDVCRDNMTKTEKAELKDHITNLRFIAGGRYLFTRARKESFLITVFYLGLRKTQEKIGLIFLGKLRVA